MRKIFLFYLMGRRERRERGVRKDKGIVEKVPVLDTEILKKILMLKWKAWWSFINDWCQLSA